MSADSALLRRLIHLLVRLFPEGSSGVTREEMEETFYDRCRAEGRPDLAFLLRELWFLLSCGVQERMEDLGPLRPLRGMTDDLRFASRALVRNKLFALGAVVMLALGIGLNAATFSLHTGLARVLQRFEDPDGLVFLNVVEEGWTRGPASSGEFFTWRDETNAFQGLGAYVLSYRYVTGDGEPLRVDAARTTPNLLPMLGMDAEAGRLFGPADTDPSAPPVAVLSWRFWQERFGGEESVLGQTILLDDTPHTIVGVLPRKADVENLWGGTEVFTTVVLNPAEEDWEARIYRVIARLASGVSAEQAQTQLSSLTARLAEARPESNAHVRARVERFEDRFYSADERLSMVGLILAVTAVLLIACINLANLLMAKGATRQGEMAIRLAMGASRGRMVRQLLSESLILSIMGGGIGIFLGRWGLDLMISGLPNPPFLQEEIGLNASLLTFTLVVCVAAALTFGLTPALLASRATLSEGVKESGAGASAGRKRKRLRTWILVGQLSLTVPLVLTCGVSFLNLRALQNTDFGFPAEGLLTAEVSLPPHLYGEPDQKARFFDAAIESVESLQGVVSVAGGMAVPIGPRQYSTWGPMVVPGRETSEGSERGPRGYQAITPGYFETLGVPIQRGRAFTPGDGPGSPQVAVVNETLARTYWPGEEAVGRILLPETDTGGSLAGRETSITEPVTVVGIVADHGASFYGEPLGPQIYLPQRQHPAANLLVVIRSSGDPLPLVPSVREAVARVDAGVPIVALRTGEGMMNEWLQESRTIGASLGVLAILALSMAILGLYGMVSHSVSQRTFELGVRMVLGANRWTVQASVMRSFVGLAAVGLAIGVVIANAVGLVARSFLVLLQVSYVPMTLGITALLMGVVVVAVLIPARRATHIEPVVALKRQ